MNKLIKNIVIVRRIIYNNVCKIKILRMVQKMIDNKYTTYSNPLTDRYCSKNMSYIFSPQFKFSTWRKLWVALAEGEKELGINISDEQIAQLKAHIDDINFEQARQIEKEVRHDVMSHVKAYGLQCPDAKGIIL